MEPEKKNQAVETEEYEPPAMAEAGEFTAVTRGAPGPRRDYRPFARHWW